MDLIVHIAEVTGSEVLEVGTEANAVYKDTCLIRRRHIKSVRESECDHRFFRDVS